jgi:hypothetical protein
MRLTWRDGITTVLAGFVIAIAVATMQGWGWPFLGTYRSAVIVLLVVAQPMCVLGLSTVKWSARDPFISLASLLGATALALIIAGIVASLASLFLALVITIELLWMVTTIDHAVHGEPAQATSNLHQMAPAA